MDNVDRWLIMITVVMGIVLCLYISLSIDNKHEKEMAQMQARIELLEHQVDDLEDDARCKPWRKGFKWTPWLGRAWLESRHNPFTRTKDVCSDLDYGAP